MQATTTLSTVYRILRNTALLMFSTVIAFAGCDYSITEKRGLGTTNDTTATGCDTIAVSYLSEVVPIIEANACLGCHTGASDLNRNVDLSMYAGVKEVAESGQLVGAITHAEDYSPMPQGLPMLDSCEIAKIRSWVRDGAQEN